MAGYYFFHPNAENRQYFVNISVYILQNLISIHDHIDINISYILRPILFKMLLETIKGQHVYDVLKSYSHSYKLARIDFVGICTNGSPTTTRSVKGFAAMALQQNHNFIITHCFLHRETLFAGIVEPELKAILDMMVKIVNNTKMRPLKFSEFEKFCESIEANHVTLIQNLDAMKTVKTRGENRYCLLKKNVGWARLKHVPEFHNCRNNQAQVSY
ncbi:hypothetical protein RF11_15148 [Thelohanellus kitauei]|uniref:SCAN domain-containing protein 3 n=1 Tax=Thelohanellus kitauei TaxID=669202 RepID=A0A0C2JV30_THEKT|nr:hypothetical protein RF11_15148 [Thelohanellus kitauei]